MILCLVFLYSNSITDELKFDVIGYKDVNEILVKTRDVRVKEIPHVFSYRTEGSGNLIFIP